MYHSVPENYYYHGGYCVARLSDVHVDGMCPKYTRPVREDNLDDDVFFLSLFNVYILTCEC